MPDLIELTVKDARRIKFEIGRLKYGTETFCGHPLKELFDECLDGMNYCDEAQKRGFDLAKERQTLEGIARRVQSLYEHDRA